jgi:hypothetical protein
MVFFAVSDSGGGVSVGSEVVQFGDPIVRALRHGCSPP